MGRQLWGYYAERSLEKAAANGTLMESSGDSREEERAQIWQERQWNAPFPRQGGFAAQSSFERKGLES